MSGMKGQTGGRRCEKPEGSREKRGATLEEQGGVGTVNSRGGWREKKE